MNLGLDLAPIIERIADRVPALRTVGGAAEFGQALADGGALAPVAFVLPARDAAGENPFASQLVQQEVTADFVVLIGAQNLTDHRGAESADELRPLRSAVATALVNWSPTADDDVRDGIEFRGGEVDSYVGSVLWWADTYQTRYLIRSE